MTAQLNYLFLGMASLFLFSSNLVQAQNYKVTDLEQLLNAPENFSDVASLSEISDLRNLVYESNSTVFVTDSGVKSFGDEVPVKGVVLPGNFELLESSSSAFNSVTLLTLKVGEAQDYNSSINLSKLSSFSNLKFILVECSFNCSFSRIQNMFSNTGDVEILYMIATPK